MTTSNSAGNFPSSTEPMSDASVDFASADLSVAIGAASGGYDGLQPDAATVQMLDGSELLTDCTPNIDSYDEISGLSVEAMVTPLDGAPGSGFLGLGDGSNGSNATLQIVTAQSNELQLDIGVAGISNSNGWDDLSFASSEAGSAAPLPASISIDVTSSDTFATPFVAPAFSVPPPVSDAQVPSFPGDMFQVSNLPQAEPATESSPAAPPTPDIPNFLIVPSSSLGASGGAGGGAGATGSSSTTSVSSASSGMTINITWDASTASAPASFKAAVTAAVQYYESQFTNPITINIDVGYGEVANQSLGSGALGESESYISSYSYSQLRSALVAKATANGDTSAVASLSATNPASGTFYVTTAEAKALGLTTATTNLDGYVGFSSSLPFNYNLTNTAVAGQYGFLGVVEHEISEVMGRISMLNSASSYSAMDLFRYAAPGAPSLTGSKSAYFSVNGGVTNLDNFNNNPSGDYGDWAASAGNDAYLAFTSSGTVDTVSPADLQLMEVLGYTPASSTSAPPQTATVIANAVAPSGTWNLDGTATAGSTVTLYNGTTQVGTTKADSSGNWTAPTAASTASVDTLTATSSGATSRAWIEGTAGNDTFSFASQALLDSPARILGNGGVDTILMTSPVTLTDADFANASGVQTLALTGASGVTLGGNAATAGITTVVTGTGMTTVADSNGVALAVNASALIAGQTLTLTGNSAVAVTLGAGNLVASGDSGNLKVFGGSSVTLGSGTDTVSFSGSGDTVTLGAGTDTVTFAGTGNTVNAAIGTPATLNSLDSLTGGSGNTLVLTGAGAFDLNSLTGFSGFQYVTLAGTGENLTLKNGQNLTVTAGSGNTVMLGSAVETVTFTSGTNRINAAASTLNSADLLVGGSGTDTLAITGAGTSASHLAAGLTSGLTSFEQLDLSGATYLDFTLGGNNQALTVIEGSNDTVSLSGSGNVITLGTGTDTVTFAGASNTVNAVIGTGATLNSLDSLTGGSGNTLVLAGAGAFDLNSLTGFSGFQYVMLGGSGESLTLKNGQNLVVAAGSGNTVTVGSGLEAVTFSSGTNRINTAASTLNSTDVFVGGSGSDTFAISGSGTSASHIAAGLSSGLTSFEQLDLSVATYVDFTLGGNNQALIVTEGSNDTVRFSGSGNVITLGSGTQTVNFSGGSTTSNSVALGAGLDSVTFANGTNTVTTTNANLTSSQTIHGGAGTDTIQISGIASVVDSDFAKVTGVEALKLGGTGANSVTVGADASADVGTGNTLTINDSAGTGNLTVNASAMTAKVSIIGGSGSNTITGGRAADSFFGHGTENGTNTFVYNTAALAQNSVAGSVDTITNFVSGTDSFKIDYTPTKLIAVSHTGTGNLATDLASALGNSTLQYTGSVKDVALVTISSGADAGIYVVIDSAHSSGYSAAQDAIIRLIGGTDPTAPRLSHDFHT
jgi:hypothetical protein